MTNRWRKALCRRFPEWMNELSSIGAARANENKLLCQSVTCLLLPVPKARSMPKPHPADVERCVELVWARKERRTRNRSATRGHCRCLKRKPLSVPSNTKRCFFSTVYPYSCNVSGVCDASSRHKIPKRSPRLSTTSWRTKWTVPNEVWRMIDKSNRSQDQV